MAEALAPIPSSGWDRRRERVARGIEAAALELFASAGAESVTIEQIAAAAGVSKRTFFRYFATRNDILAAMPRRALARTVERVRARPASESMIDSLSAAHAHGDDAEDPDAALRLLWGKAVEASPAAAAEAFGRSAVSMEETYRELVIDRLGFADDDPKARVLGVAIAAVVGSTYRGWVHDDGREPLGKLLAEAFEALRDLDAHPPAKNAHLR